MRARLGLWADLIQIGQGVGFVFGAVGVATGYLLAFPVPLIVALAVGLFGIGIVITFLILELGRRRGSGGSAAETSVSTSSGRRAMADFITEQHAYGVHELLNKVPTLDDGGYALVEWAEKGAAWVERILRTMTERGCTRQELAVLEPLGLPRYVKGYSQGSVIEHRLDMIQERLGRLKELEKQFSQDSSRT